jgi:hypothetical protein
MSEEVKEECPKCDRPATTHRWKAGEKHWICGNGHNWTSEESKRKQRAKENESQPATTSISPKYRRWKYTP